MLLPVYRKDENTYRTIVQKKKSKKKVDFYLEEKDADSFAYEKMYYISDIKNELNRICTADGVKKVTISSIWNFLVKEGYTQETNYDGIFVKEQTQKRIR
mgnify:CR=1 FL=1